MPRPQKLSRFPPEYFQLFQQVKPDEPVHIRMGTREGAERLRFRLYAFRESLIAYHEEVDADLPLHSLGLSFTINEEGSQCVLVIQEMNDDTPERIREALRARR